MHAMPRFRIDLLSVIGASNHNSIQLRFLGVIWSFTSTRAHENRHKFGSTSTKTSMHSLMRQSTTHHQRRRNWHAASKTHNQRWNCIDRRRLHVQPDALMNCSPLIRLDHFHLVSPLKALAVWCWSCCKDMPVIMVDRFAPTGCCQQVALRCRLQCYDAGSIENLQKKGNSLKLWNA